MLLPLCLQKVPHRSHSKGPVRQPPYCRLHLGRRTWWSRPAASIWGTQRGVLITIPFHTPAHVHPAAGGALSPVCAPRGHSLLAFGTFLPSVGKSPRSRWERWQGHHRSPREARVHTLSPTSPAQGPCRLHPGPRQWAGEGLKSTPEGTEEPSGPDLPALVSGAFRQA